MELAINMSSARVLPFLAHAGAAASKSSYSRTLRALQALTDAMAQNS
jgi:hypothetical protein